MKTLKLAALSLALCAGTATADSEYFNLKVLSGGIDLATTKEQIKLGYKWFKPSDKQVLDVRLFGRGVKIDSNNKSLLVAGIISTIVTLPEALSKINQFLLSKYQGTKFDITEKKNFVPVLKATASLALMSAGMALARSNA